MKKLTLVIAAFALVVGISFGHLPNPAAAAEVIKWGVLIDLSGPTSDWGKNQVKGQLDAMRWVNENGGINGKELKLIVIDDGYKVPRGVAGYNRLVDSEKVLGLYIQSTGTTMTLIKKIVSDGVATIAASFTSKFQNPAKTPFSFFCFPILRDHGADCPQVGSDHLAGHEPQAEILLSLSGQQIRPGHFGGRQRLCQKNRCRNRTGPGHQLAHERCHGSADQYEPLWT